MEVLSPSLYLFQSFGLALKRVQSACYETFVLFVVSTKFKHCLLHFYIKAKEEVKGMKGVKAHNYQLLRNILPEHVAHHFLGQNRINEVSFDLSRSTRMCPVIIWIWHKPKLVLKITFL